MYIVHDEILNHKDFYIINTLQAGFFVVNDV